MKVKDRLAEAGDDIDRLRVTTERVKRRVQISLTT